jgi:hypothetical protein
VIVHKVEQNSPEWHQLRLGIPTSSEFDKIITPKTQAPSTQARAYMHRLLAEWIIGQPLDLYESRFMQRGHELENNAVEAYEFEREVETERIGFITSNDAMKGCSPDRLVKGTKGSLEIKVATPSIHVGRMLERSVASEHKCQIQGQIWIAELEWVDAESYCPGLPTVIVRAERDDKFIQVLSSAVNAFAELMLECRTKLVQQWGPFKQPEAERVEEPDPWPVDWGITESDVDAIIAQQFSKQ